MAASTTDLVHTIEKAVQACIRPIPKSCCAGHSVRMAQAVTQSSRCMVFFIDDDEAKVVQKLEVPMHVQCLPVGVGSSDSYGA